MFKKLTIKHKVFILAGLGAILALAITIGSIYSIKQVGQKLRQIAEEDIPLTTAITNITVHQLEQAIMLERAMRYAEIVDHNPAAKDEYQKAKTKFLSLAKKVDQEILDAEKQAADIIAYETSHGGEQYIIDEFIYVEKILKEIEVEHKAFDNKAKKVMKLFETGRIAQAEYEASKISEQEDKLDHKLEALLVEIETFTAEAAIKAEKTEQRLEKILLITSLASTVIFVFIAIAIVRGIVKPLAKTKDYADELSKGNLAVEQPVHNFQDEIADMMSSLSIFKDNAIEAKRLRDAQAKQELRAEEEKKQAMAELAERFDEQVGSVIDSLAGSASEMQKTAESLKHIADETMQSSQTVSMTSEQSSMNVNTVASAIEEMSAASSEIASQITSASVKSNDTAESARSANETVSNLNSLVENIGAVVTSIQDIAEQTNLLALNATIEAARAGEAGKGFAVVADEVKKLASETAQKTEEIGSQIAGIQDATRSSVDVMQRIIQNISEIDVAVTGVTGAVEEQNATTAEISRSVGDASQGTAQVSQIITEVQKSAEETGASAESVLSNATEVANLSDTLKSSVNDFLNQIRGGDQDKASKTADSDIEQTEAA